MAISLFAASLMLLTGSADFFVNLAARALQPVFGRIDSARPALMIVPAGAGLALILRRLIPDMGRCRLAQTLVVCSTLLLVVRAFARARMNSPTEVFHLTTLELLISGLVLSAFQLHARYVIHINPNPPLSAQRKASVHTTHSEFVNTATTVADAIEPVSLAGVSEASVLENKQIASGETTAADIVSVPALNPVDQVKHLAVDITNSATADAQSKSQPAPQAKDRSSKKQKLRKAG